MSPRATDRADAARRPENAPVALVASAEKGTGPGHLAASPLRDRTNVRAAAAEASPSSDAVAESEEEDDSGPARSRRPFGVPVGAANRAVLEQMLRRDAPTRSALTRVSAEASPSGRGGAAEPPRARPTDESPVEPHQRESRRKRRRRRSPRGSREEEEEEDASMARRGKRRNASSPSFETAFEVADGAGDVSEHSDASHDRTAGVHGFNFQELRGDAYGRGRRRRDGGDADRVARRIAARRRGALEISSEDSDSDSDSEDDDAILRELGGGSLDVPGAALAASPRATGVGAKGGGSRSLGSSASAALAAAALEFVDRPLARPPRLLLAGAPGAGQTPLGAALLHELEAFPVHAGPSLAAR